MMPRNHGLLIVDDSLIVRRWLAKIVSQIPGIQLIGEAESVARARLMIQELHPEIVILDLNLPDGTGFMVLDEIKTICPETKVIILTNYPFAQHRVRAATAGAEYFFDKSMEFDKVADTIKSFVEQEHSSCSQDI